MNASGWWPAAGDIDISGDFSVTAIGNVVNRDLVQNLTTFVRDRPAFYLGPDEIADRVACYVPAGNHDLIEKALESHHAILLTGPRGCGRETTAIAAIRRLRAGIPIRRFSLDREDAEEIDARGACGYLVRAADGGLDRLPRCVEAARAGGGYLVVIGDGEPEIRQAVSALAQLTVEPPHPVQVYRLRLARRGLGPWATWETAPALLEGALPADARRLADLVESADRRGGDFAKQRHEVAQEYRGWKDELRAWFEEHRQPHERALLVAAATLSPTADEKDVYAAAAALAQRLKITTNGGGLVWCPVTGLRDLLKAEHDEDRVVFRRHGFADSAVRHALTDYPLARPAVVTWLASLPTNEAVTHRLPASLAGTFADLAAEHGMARQIADAAERWGTDDHADLAFIALSRTCLHPLVGGRIRRILYEWSRTADTPQTLKLTIARVCEPLGQTYPSIALTRLKHLATHGNLQVAREVIEAAMGLVKAGNRDKVLAAALAWCAETDLERLSAAARHRRIRAGAMLFLELAGQTTPSGLPELLHGAGAINPLTCTPAWRAALRAWVAAPESPDLTFQRVVRRWLDAALADPRLRGRIVGSFVDAAASSTIPYGITGGFGTVGTTPIAARLLSDMARRWAAVEAANPVRRQIKEDIVVPLTSPWPLRQLKRLYIRARTLITIAGGDEPDGRVTRHR